MGLFGPSWTWEELRKKDDIMNDLKRENDRILDKQRKENDRVLRKQRKLNDSTYQNNSNNAVSSMTSDDYYFLNQTKFMENYAKSELHTGNVILGKYIGNIPSLLENLIGLTICVILALLCMRITWLLVIFLIIIIGVGYKTFENIRYCLIHPLKESNKMRETKCYQAILEELKHFDIENIKYITLNNKHVLVIDRDNKKTTYLYSNYNFPDLPFKKQSILLSTLIKDLQIKNILTFNVKYGYSIDNALIRGINREIFKDTNYEAYFYAENKKLISKIAREEKNKETEKINSGETW